MLFTEHKKMLQHGHWQLMSKWNCDAFFRRVKSSADTTAVLTLLMSQVQRSVLLLTANEWGVPRVFRVLVATDLVRETYF